jgi:ABC-2 type transport system ATP-binding protein
LISSIGAEQMVEIAAAGDALQRLDASVLLQLEGVRQARLDNGHYLLSVSELHRSVPAVLDELARRRVQLTELRTHSASLEDVFVSLTGRSLRDE